MMIDSTVTRIRAYMTTFGITRRALAGLAGLWEGSIRNINAPNWNPTVSTLRKLEAVIPPDFNPEPEQEEPMAKKPCGKGGRRK